MRRALLALCGVAAGFAALVDWLGLARDSAASVWVAVGVFFWVLAFGLPTLRCYCCKGNRWEAWRLLLLGATAGVLVALPFLGGPFGSGFLLTVFALAGGGLALLFWLAAVWHNEDLTCPKSFCLPCGAVYRVARNALRRARPLQSK